MSLFDVNKLASDAKKIASSAKVGSGPRSFSRSTNSITTLSDSYKRLKELVPEIGPNTLVHFNTGGKWHRHQLLTHLLKLTGPADVYLSTWSMSENPVRALYMLKKQGAIKAAHLVISERINERTPKVLQFAKSTFERIAYQKLHAKITLIEGEQKSFVIIGSANLTRNPKDEAGIIDTSAGAIDFWKNWFDNEFN